MTASNNIGTIFSYPNNPRVWKALISAQYLGLKVDCASDFEMGVTNKDAKFLAKFPLGKIPAMDSASGPVYESDAIAFFVANYVNDSPLLGANNYERSQIMQYVSLASNEYGRHMASWVYPLLGYATYNKEAEKTAIAGMQRSLSSLNIELANKTFLVGERVTLADIVVVCTLYLAFDKVLDVNFRSSIPHVARWYQTCVNQPHFAKVMGKVEMCETAATMDFSKLKKDKPKEDKPKAADKPKEEKKASKKAVKKDDDEEEEESFADEEPKRVNPLDSLPPSAFVLDAWKRFYSNNDPRPAAIDYFWGNFETSGWSMWKVDYKYNEELEAVFKSSNLIGGFFQRLDRARKYAFGSMMVCGDSTKSSISGYFVLRGQEVPFEVTDAADYDSYKFTKVDPADAKVKETFNDYLAWDGNNLPGVFADGKIFK